MFDRTTDSASVNLSMLDTILRQYADRNDPVVVTPDGVMTWAQFVGRIDDHARQFKQLAGRRVLFRLVPNADAIAALFALQQFASNVFLCDGRTSGADLLKLCQDFDLSATVSVGQDGGHMEPLLEQSPGLPQLQEAGRFLTILTSGTTGKPKAVRHTWASIARPIRRSEQFERTRWLLTYRPHLYAGLQVILQCLVNGGVLAIANANSSANEIAQLAASSKTQFASGTPSFWRSLITFNRSECLRSIPFKQITLGGEVVDQPTLDSLRMLYPRARLVHIYATTELGRCFSVTDGRAGFPANFLNATSPDGVDLRIDDGELIVRSANAMQGYDFKSGDMPQSDWFRTGDLVRLESDRVFFVGRKSEIINVGGNKVHPVEVEKVIREVSGVADVRVFAKSSSIVGQLIACEIVLVLGSDRYAVERDIRARCQQLGSHQRPRFITFVNEFKLTDAGKATRS